MQYKIGSARPWRRHVVTSPSINLSVSIYNQTHHRPRGLRSRIFNFICIIVEQGRVEAS